MRLHRSRALHGNRAIGCWALERCMPRRCRSTSAPLLPAATTVTAGAGSLPRSSHLQRRAARPLCYVQAWLQLRAVSAGAAGAAGAAMSSFAAGAAASAVGKASCCGATAVAALAVGKASCWGSTAVSALAVGNAGCCGATAVAALGVGNASWCGATAVAVLLAPSSAHGLFARARSGAGWTGCWAWSITARREAF